MPITLGVNFKSPLLAVDVKRLAVFHVYVLVEIVVELVSLVDVFWVDLISLSKDKYKRVIDFLAKLIKMSYF